MMSLTPIMPPAPTEQAQNTVEAILAIIAHPDTAKKRFKELQQHYAELQTLHEQISGEIIKISEANQKLEADRNELGKREAQISSAETKLDRREKTLAQREADLRDGQQSLGQERNEFAKTKANTEHLRIAAEQVRDASNAAFARAEAAEKRAGEVRAEYEAKINGLKELLRST